MHLSGRDISCHSAAGRRHLFGCANRMNPEAKHLRERLKVLSLTNYSEKEVDLMRKKTLSQVPLVQPGCCSDSLDEESGPILQQRLSGTVGFLYCFRFAGLGGRSDRSFVTRY